MKLLQITALALLLHIPLTHTMDQCTTAGSLTAACAFSAAGLAYFQHTLHASLKEKVKKACDEQRAEWEEGEAHDEEAAHHAIRRRYTPAQAQQMDDASLALTQLQVVEEDADLATMAISCCGGAVMGTFMTLATCSEIWK